MCAKKVVKTRKTGYDRSWIAKLRSFNIVKGVCFVMRAYERLLDYVRVYTTSDPESGTHPSAAREFDLAHKLVEELKALGVDSMGTKMPWNAPRTGIWLSASGSP